MLWANTEKAALLSIHGAIACGVKIEDAFLVSDYMERQAQLVIYATLIGGAKEVRHEDMFDKWV